jgi:hypothetical protein
MGSVIPGSTEGCDRVRRVVYPLLGVSDDNEGLEMSRWSLREDMVGLNAGPTGQKHRFGIGCGRFGGTVEMRGVSVRWEMHWWEVVGGTAGWFFRRHT